MKNSRELLDELIMNTDDSFKDVKSLEEEIVIINERINRASVCIDNEKNKYNSKMNKMRLFPYVYILIFIFAFFKIIDFSNMNIIKILLVTEISAILSEEVFNFIMCWFIERDYKVNMLLYSGIKKLLCQQKINKTNILNKKMVEDKIKRENNNPVIPFRKEYNYDFKSIGKVRKKVKREE